MMTEGPAAISEDVSRYRLFCATWTKFESSSGLPALPEAAESARGLSSALRELDLLIEEPVRLINQTGVACITNLEHFLKTPGDDVIIYLSSHGLVSQGDSPLFRLATCDTRQASDLTRALPLLEVTALLGKSEAARKLLIVDACYAGRAGAGLWNQVINEANLTSEMCLLASSSPLESSRVSSDGLTAFASALVSTLRSGLAGRPETITIADLCEAVNVIQTKRDVSTAHMVAQGNVGQRLRFRNPAANLRIDPSAFANRVARYDYRAEILYVDDEAEPRKTFVEALNRAGHQVTTVDSGPAAAAALDRSHFDIIVLDLLLGGDDPATDVIAMCSRRAPDALIFVVSRRDFGSKDLWGKLHLIFAHPSRISGFIWKGKYIPQIEGYAQTIRERRQEVLSRIDHLEPAVTLVTGRMIGRDESLLDQSEAIQLELRVTVENVVADWLAPADGKSFIESVSLRPVDSGKSRCAVFTMIPRLRGVEKSDVMPLILKLGPAAEIEQEEARYNRYVQVGVPLDLRTDKIAASVVGRVGAILYSFRGGHQGIIEEIGQLGAEEILKCMRVIFNPEHGRKWFATQVDGRVFPLSHYEELGYPDFNPAVTEMREAIKKLVPPGVESPTRRESEFWLQALHEEPPITGDQPATLVHGDLNLGNLVRCDDGRYAMIDYRTVGIGPRLVDFATIEVSCWLTARGPIRRDRRELFAEARQAVIGSFEDDRDPDEIPEWLREPWRLVIECRRLALENTKNEATSEEYAALLWLAAVRRSTLKGVSSTSERNAQRVLLPAIALAAQGMLTTASAAR